MDSNAPLRSNRIDLIDEDDTRGILLCNPEELPDELGSVSEVLLDELGSDDTKEGRRRLVGDGFREEGLSGSGHSVEDDSLGRSDTHLLVEFWVGEGELDGFLEERDAKGERK